MPQNAKKPVNYGVLLGSEDSGGVHLVGDEGLEETTARCDSGLTVELTSQGISNELQVINDLWPTLDAATRLAVLHLLLRLSQN